MKKFLIAILLFFPTFIVSQQKEETKVTPVMWKVEAEKPVYLMGTIHMGVNATEEFHSDVWEKLSQCKTLVLELDMTKINQFEMAQKMMLPPGQSLDELLGEKHWGQLTTFIAPYPAAAFQNFKPWALQSIFAQKLMPITPSVEAALMQKAAENNITLEALETANDQIDAMEKVPQDKMVKSIKETLDDIPGAKKEALEMLKAYKEGDIKALTKATIGSQEAKNMPEMIEHLVFNRNKTWIPALEEYIKKGNVFVAVGAGHFIGKQGIIALLKEKGYKVTRISFTEEK